MGGVSALRWFRPRRDDGDGRDDDLGSGQKAATIVTTVTEKYKLWKGLSKMIGCNIMLTEKERYDLLMAKLIDAMRNSDWDTISSLITFNACIMAVGLEAVYRILPDEYKFSIPTECHTHNGDHIPTVRKYVRQARKYAPIEKRIPAEMIALPEIEMYRAGEESLDKAAYRISWTTSIDVAKWFYDRAVARLQPQRHIYKGIIKPEKIIWYTDGRQEKEVMQYNSVRNIVELER